MAASSGGGKQKISYDIPSQSKPIQSMRLFSEWDVENAAPSCIPRSCCLRVVRLQVFKTLEPELKALVICVAMQGSRRSLRSDQIPTQSSGTLEVDLDLIFTLQYPHFLKRRENHLQITLQRRKKYRNRTILGYKNLAVGHVNMAQVLQGWYSKELHLYTKDKTTPVATLTIASLSSDPIDRDIQTNRRLVENQESSDEEGDDDSYSSDVDDSAGEMDREHRYSREQIRRNKQVQSRNFKQKIVQALFKKLKVAEELGGNVQDELQKELQEDEEDEEEYDIVGDEEGLFFDDEDSNDSDNEDDILLEDNSSIASAKKPGLRPYFDQSKSQTTLNQTSLTKEEAKALSMAVVTAMRENQTSQDENSDDLRDDNESRYVIDRHVVATDQPLQSHDDHISSSSDIIKTKQELSKKSSNDPDYHLLLKGEPISRYQDQLLSIFGADDKLPDHILMIATKDEFCQNMAKKLKVRMGTVLTTTSFNDVQATITAILSKFQKYCNRHASSPPPLRIGIFGTESYVRNVLKAYVEQFSNKPQDYQTFVRFLIIPIAPNKVGTYLTSIDSKYNTLFNDGFWKNVFLQPYLSDQDSLEVEKRIMQYLENSEIVHSIPIAEALITARLPENTDSSQFFLPFVTEVRMGSNESSTNDVDSDSGSSKEPSSEKSQTGLTSSPRAESCEIRSPSTSIQSNENLDLTVDYWPVQNVSQILLQQKEKKEVNKTTVKSTFRSLSVSRLPCTDSEDASGLMFNANLKNRNKGVKRLMNKKDKDTESISVAINKLVCTARNSGHTFNVQIDGKEWCNVKFFSLSHQWPTHIKQFPIGLFLNYGGNIDQT